MAENRQYDEMLAAAARRLRGADPGTLAERAGLEWDGRCLEATSFGQRVRIDADAFRATPQIDMWHHLALLQYLAGADGSLPTRRWIGIAELPEGGLVRGASFDREVDRLVAAGLGGCDMQALRRACGALGAVVDEDGPADLSADFDFMPRFPLRLNLWLADDEFPPSGKLLVNAGVAHCLGTEAIGTVGCMLVGRLCALASG